MTSLFRAQLGLGILVGMIVAACFATGSARQRVATLVLALLAYYALSTGVLDLAYQARAQRMRGYPVNTGGVADITDWSDPAGHPFWHTAYIGLGVTHNRYRISYNDSAAANYVKTVDPRAIYLSARYERILRKRYLHIVTHDPGFAFRAYVEKVRLLAQDGLGRFPALLVLLPIAVAAGAIRRRRAPVIGVGSALLLIGVAPALLAIPLADYETGWLGFLAALTAVTAGFLIARVSRPLAPAGDYVLDAGAHALLRMTLPARQAVHRNVARARLILQQVAYACPKHGVDGGGARSCVGARGRRRDVGQRPFGWVPATRRARDTRRRPRAGWSPRAGEPSCNGSGEQHGIVTQRTRFP